MSTKFASPLLGYNNNVRHKGKVFHIQTEDSGVKYGHIITHLFMDGGRILKSVKTSYAEYIGNDRMADIVKEMMKQQHKAMFIALRDGKFDPMTETGADASQTTRALVDESPPKPSAPGPSAAVAEAAAVQSVPAAVPPPGTPPPLPAAATAAAMAKKLPSRTPPPLERSEDGPATIRQPPPAELTLDIDALERAASAVNAASPVLRTNSDLPPPPPNLFREKATSGKYRMTPVPPSTASTATKTDPAPPPRMNSPSAPVRRPAQVGAAAERRYAPTRPAAIFGQARPQQGKSIFGEDLISDKSLDEVILSYLADDLDEKK
jgi:RecA/RadA recombinase